MRISNLLPLHSVAGTLKMVQSGMRCLRSCAASGDSRLLQYFIMVAALDIPACSKAITSLTGLGISTQFLIARDSCRSCSNHGQPQVSSNWPSFSTQVGTGIGSEGSEILSRSLATSAELESPRGNRRVGAGYRD